MFQTIDKYIESFPKEVQTKLQSLGKIIKQTAPEAIETISYQMLTFKLNGNLIHFAAYQNHIGLYPTPNGISSFEDELAPYKHAKGSAQFPLDKPLPLELISKIVKYRVEENTKKK